MDSRHYLGLRGEELAVRILLDQGYQVHGQNLRTRFGEIDILAQQGSTLIAVEVKTRSKSSFPWVHHALTQQKLQKVAGTLLRVSYTYSHISDLRVDVLLLCVDNQDLLSYELLSNVYRPFS